MEGGSNPFNAKVLQARRALAQTLALTASWNLKTASVYTATNGKPQGQ
jgi:hypothetical protein